MKNDIIETTLKRSEIEIIIKLIDTEIKQCKWYGYEPYSGLYEIRNSLKQVLDRNK